MQDLKKSKQELPNSSLKTKSKRNQKGKIGLTTVEIPLQVVIVHICVRKSKFPFRLLVVVVVGLLLVVVVDCCSCMYILSFFILIYDVEDELV